MTHPQEEIEMVKVGKPAKRWRNRYALICEAPISEGESIGPGVETTRHVWPSYEIAEHVGRQFEAWFRRHDLRFDYGCVTYLGPIQVEDAGE